MIASGGVDLDEVYGFALNLATRAGQIWTLAGARDVLKAGKRSRREGTGRRYGHADR